MKALVCGADGFLGRHIADALQKAGHTVVRGVRRPRLPSDIAMDYRVDCEVEAWLPRVAGFEAVINAVGILNEQRPGDFDAIHHRAPAALFEACRRAGVDRIVQISALGSAATPYLESKRAADRALLAALPHGVVLRPGLVFGRDGASTHFFLMLASLPVIGDLRGAGDVQPVHLDDVVAATVRLAEGVAASPAIVDLPGPRRLSYRDWLNGYRHAMGLAPAVFLPIPALLTTAAAWMGGRFRGSMLSPDTWKMLRAGNTGDPAAAQALLGRNLKDPDDFVAPEDAELLRLRALAAWRAPLLRAVLAFLWIASAVLSAAVYPFADSLALLAPFGLTDAAAPIVLGAASLLDLLMGGLTIRKPGRRLWLAQLALIAGYSLLVAWKLPAFLIHPFAPILKNLAVGALLVQLWAEETRP